jgi:hypothetical protein
MDPLEQTLLVVISQARPARRALQRWALRYAARTLFKFGGSHLESADLLQELGEATGGHTMIGRPPSIRTPASVHDMLGETRPLIRTPTPPMRGPK